MIIDRREFLKKAAVFSTMTACSPWLLSIFSNLSCSSLKSKTGFSPTEISSLLAAALKRAGDFSEVYIEEIASLSFRMSERKFSQATVGITGGTGIRTVDKDRIGYAYINGDEYKKALNAAETSAYIASGSGAVNVAELREVNAPDTIRVAVPVDSISEQRKMELVQAAEEAARAYSPYIKQVDITYYDHVKSRKIANSNGFRIENDIPLIWIVIEVLAEKNGIRHQGRARMSAHQGFEFFDTNDMTKTTLTAAAEAVAMLDAKPSPSGMMPVVMNCGWGGVLIHEAVGHGLEGDFIFKNTSIYCDKLGKKIASPLVTLVDDSSWPNARGTTGFDDEGTPGQRNVLIENGVLRSYMQDMISAKMLNAPLTGNGRRESYRNYPIPRMTNTFLDTGNSAPDKIIADTKKGIYVKALSGGSVDTISGQFNFVVREAYLIENGQITHPIAGATLIGKGIDVLTNIDAVGSDLELGVGTCGKSDQWAPVTSGMPTIRIGSGIIVGGTA